MIAPDDRTHARRVFFDTWQKHKTHTPLSPLENQILPILLMHPEYHPLLDNPEKYADIDFSPTGDGTNPFLHLALHLGLNEQIAADNPKGIADIYKHLMEKIKEPLEVEHRMMECLAKTLWHMQKDNVPFDTNAYLAELNKII